MLSRAAHAREESGPVSWLVGSSVPALVAAVGVVAVTVALLVALVTVAVRGDEPAATTVAAVPSGSAPAAAPPSPSREPSTAPSSTAPSPSPAGSTPPAPSSTTTAPPPPPSPAPPALPPAPQDVVWIDTPVLTHDKDFHDLSAYLAPDVPTDWTSPVDYAGGEATVRLEVLSSPNPGAVPVYYTVGWRPGDGSERYIRAGIKVTSIPSVEEIRVPVKDWQRVVDGLDAGAVGDDWPWDRAFQRPNGDTWGSNGAPYPMEVRLRVVLHPAS